MKPFSDGLPLPPIPALAFAVGLSTALLPPPLLLYLLKALALKHSINSAYPDCIAQHANVGIVRGISTREFHDRYGGIVHGISLVGFG